MKTPVLPAPNKELPRIGTIQWIDFGEQVQANHNSPMGIRIAEMVTIDIIASGGGFPVLGSGEWELIMRRTSGSKLIMMKMPTPIPRNPRPLMPRDQPRMSPNTTGYATKQRYRMPYTTPT